MKMTYYSLKNRISVSESVNVDFDEAFDVIVAGMGTAGALAAIVSASKGVKTLGIDRLNGMGGLGTLGVIWDYFFGSPGGYYEEIDKSAREMNQFGYAHAEPRDNSFGGRCIAGTVKEAALERYSDENGLARRYETSVIGVFCDSENKIAGLRTVCNKKFLNIGAKYIIDCTGSALICRMLGLETEYGRDTDGKIMHFSKGVGAIHNSIYLHGLYRMCFDGDYDAMKLSSEILSESSAGYALRTTYTSETRMVYDSTIIGRRESARVRTLERLTLDSITSGKPTDKPLFYIFTPLDNTNHDSAMESEVNRNWSVISRMNNFGYTIAVPAGIFIPAHADGSEVKGLMVAGKGMGLDRDMSTGFRMKKDFQKCGEAVGLLAATAVMNGISAAEADYKIISDELRKSGCLDESNNIGLASITIHDCRHVNYDLPDIADWNKLDLILSNPAPSSEHSLTVWSMCVNSKNPDELAKSNGFKYLSERLYSENDTLAFTAAVLWGVYNGGANKESKDYKRTVELLYGYLTNPSELDNESGKPKLFVSAMDILRRMEAVSVIDFMFEIGNDIKNYAEKWMPNYNRIPQESEYNLMAYVLMALLNIIPAKPDNNQDIKRLYDFCQQLGEEYSGLTNYVINCIERKKM